MKFDISSIPENYLNDDVMVGDVYPAKGGNGAKAFIVVSVRERAAHAIGIDRNGEIITTTSYGIWTFERRKKIGFCPEIARLNLTIERIEQ